jgi:hypothetical protein
MHHIYVLSGLYVPSSVGQAIGELPPVGSDLWAQVSHNLHPFEVAAGLHEHALRVERPRRAPRVCQDLQRAAN